MSNSDIISHTNYIYLLQEREFTKTEENVYKVGRTIKPNYQRFNQYPNGSILIFQMICNDCVNIEREIIKKFKDIFNQKKEYGTEYFEGDYKKMIDIIYLTIKNEEYNDNDENKIKKEEDYDEDERNELKSKILFEKISEIFPDYKNDESFGGLKKYIKISRVDDSYVIYYLCPGLKNHNIYNYCDEETEIEDIFDDYIITLHKMKSNVIDNLEYFNNLISKKKILIDKVYDINSNIFIDIIIKSKINLVVENHYAIKRKCREKYFPPFNEKLRELFYCNMIINNELYSTMFEEDVKKFKNLKDFDNCDIDIGQAFFEEFITLYKINSKFYDYDTYLRKYIPYLIRWKNNGEYYILNRDYEYIGLDTKSIKYEYFGEKYLFNDGCKPWKGKNLFIDMCNKYEKIIKDNSLKECLNPHKFTENIMCSFF
jgi:hypothetical protein